MVAWAVATLERDPLLARGRLLLGDQCRRGQQSLLQTRTTSTGQVLGRGGEVLDANYRCRARARGRRVHALVTDAARLACRDHSVDGIVLHLVLVLVPDPVAAIREAARRRPAPAARLAPRSASLHA
jgi:hypothetical protein